MSMVLLLVIGMHSSITDTNLIRIYYRFEVNLTNARGDIVLHVNPRVSDRQLVLNAAPGGGWGNEERKPLNISSGQSFNIIIMSQNKASK